MAGYACHDPCTLVSQNEAGELAVWASPVPEDRVGPAVDLETVAAAEAAGAKSGEAASNCSCAAQHRAIAQSAYRSRSKVIL